MTESTTTNSNARSLMRPCFEALTIDELKRLSWLRGRLEAQAFALCTTRDHIGWDCDWQTAGRLSCARWRVVTGELNEGFVEAAA